MSVRRRGCLTLALLLLSGCQGMFGSRGAPEDPLFLDKKPLEAKAETAPPAHVTWSEPAPPSNPYFADGPRTIQGTLTGRPKTGPKRDDQ